MTITKRNNRSVKQGSMALNFVHTAAQYVAEHPNDPYQADYQNGSMTLTQILTADHHAANVLHVTNVNE
jgi:hypothetical protein